MSGQKSEVREKVREWMRSADEDIRFAEEGMRFGESSSYRIIAYLAQQCAEKYLKAYLVFRGFRFSYSHDIAYLLESCSRFALWANEIRDAEELTILCDDNSLSRYWSNRYI